MSKLGEELDEARLEELAQDLHFKDVASGTYMGISRDTEGAKWPLEISILGMEPDCEQTYNMNENELFALFNLLTEILTGTHEKRSEELRHKSAILCPKDFSYNSLQEDEQ